MIAQVCIGQRQRETSDDERQHGYISHVKHCLTEFASVVGFGALIEVFTCGLSVCPYLLERIFPAPGSAPKR
jgi:hypothetical protein